MKKFFAIALALAITAFTGCGSPSSPNSGPANGTVPSSAGSKSEITSVSIGSGPSGGNQEVIGAAVAEIWNSHRVGGIAYTAVPTGGTAVNIQLLDAGENQIVMSTSDTAVRALKSETPFNKSYNNIRGLFCTYPNTLQIWVSKSSGITSFKDLKSHRFTYGQPGTGSYQPAIELMKLSGFTEDDVKAAGGSIEELGWGDAVSALKDGTLDAVIWTTSYPSSNIVDAGLTTDINLLQIDPDLLKKYKADHAGWVDVTIPAGAYKNQSADVTTIGTYNTFICSADLSEDLVYNLVKAAWENVDILGNTYAPLKELTGETFSQDTGIPLHPGAEKYYKEKGWL